jgi:hypothetical protein
MRTFILAHALIHAVIRAVIHAVKNLLVLMHIDATSRL